MGNRVAWTYDLRGAIEKEVDAAVKAKLKDIEWQDVYRQGFMDGVEFAEHFNQPEEDKDDT